MFPKPESPVPSNGLFGKSEDKKTAEKSEDKKTAEKCEEKKV